MAQTHSLDLEASSSQYASISDASQTGLDLSGSFSFEAWVKIESTFSGTTRYILGKAANPYPSARSYGFGVAESGGVYKLSLIHSNGSTQEFQQSDAWTFGLGIWYHLAVTFDTAGDVKFYVNGAQHGAAKASALTSTSVNSADFVIGNTPYLIGSEGYWDGLLKDVRVFSDVRTQTEIAADAYTEAVSDANLVGEWNFNNAYTDSSGNGNTLTASGSPVFSTDIPWEAPTSISGSTYLETNLVSYYEAESDMTDSHGSNDLTKVNSPSHAAGVIDNGLDLELSSSQYAYITDAAQAGLDFSGDMAFSIWLKPESIPSTEMSLAAKTDGGSARSYNLAIQGTGDGSTLKGFVSGNGSTAVRVQTTSTAAIIVSGDIGNLVHILASFSIAEAKWRFYKNGIEVATSSNNAGTVSTIYNSSNMFQIGASNYLGTPDSYLDGVVDEIAAYGRALHYGDVLDLYNNGSGIIYASPTSAFVPRIMIIS